LLQELLHEVVAGLGQAFAGGGVHAVFEEEQFFVEMVDGGPFVLLVLHKAAVKLRRKLGIVHRLTFPASISESAGDADSAEGFQTVGVLHAGPFQRVHRRGDAGSLEGKLRDDTADVIRGGLIRLHFFQPFAGSGGAGLFVAAGEFPIGDVMEQRGELHEEQVRVLFASDGQGHAADPVDVPPIVPGAVSGEQIADVFFGAGKNEGLIHGDIVTEDSRQPWPEEIVPVTPLVRVGREHNIEREFRHLQPNSQEISMARPNAVTFKGTPMTLAGEEVKVGQSAPDFKIHYFEGGLKTITPADLKGKATILSVVPSLDTGVCATQTKKFNDQLAALGDKVNAVTVSLDLPFAMNRFCGAESIKNMKVGSDYQDRNFGKNWGMLIEELKLLARGVFVLDKNGKVVHAETVKEVTSEPNYEAAMTALKGAV
jgi:thiol peroxidase